MSTFAMPGTIPYAEARAGQSDALAHTHAVVRDRIAELVTERRLAGPGPILVGIGASLSAACAPVWVMRSRGIDAWRLAAGDHPLPLPDAGRPLVGISQSGRSPETIAVLGSVARARRLAVTNARTSPLADTAAATICLGDMADSYASTVGHTATVMGLGMLADAWDGGTVAPSWADVPGWVASLDDDLASRVDDLAAVVGVAGSVDVVGQGSSLGSAEAGALLLREVARRPATAASTRTYLHGPMESAGLSAHIVLGEERELSLCRTLAEAGRTVILISPLAVPERERLRVIRIPDLPPAQRAILEAVVLQALSAALAAAAAVPVDEFVFHHPDTKVGDAPGG
jgi:glucosamine--fructose-6-phosphate aminotransferase (isomerizing)